MRLSITQVHAGFQLNIFDMHWNFCTEPLSLEINDYKYTRNSNLHHQNQQAFIRGKYFSNACVTPGAKHSMRTTMWVSSNSIHARIGDFGFTLRSSRCCDPLLRLIKRSAHPGHRDERAR
jgi:hypothetical protein